MRIKITALTVICLVIVGALAYVHAQTMAATTPPAMPAGAIGRYQVIAADIDSEGLGGNLKHRTAIRIDTQTGRT